MVRNDDEGWRIDDEWNTIKWLINFKSYVIYFNFIHTVVSTFKFSFVTWQCHWILVFYFIFLSHEKSKIKENRFVHWYWILIWSLSILLFTDWPFIASRIKSQRHSQRIGIAEKVNRKTFGVCVVVQHAMCTHFNHFWATSGLTTPLLLNHCSDWMAVGWIDFSKCWFQRKSIRQWVIMFWPIY